MARPSLADSLKASLSKGVHVDTAERIKQGLPPVSDPPTPQASEVTIPELSTPEPNKPSHEPSYVTSVDVSYTTSDDSSHVTPDEPYNAMSNGSSHSTSYATSNEPSNVSQNMDERHTERETNRDTDVTNERLLTRQTHYTEQRQTERLVQRDTERYPSRQTERITYHHDPIMTLTVRQGMCLYYLLQRPDYIAQRHTMGQALNLPLPTIRDCITVLVRERFISKPQKIVIRSFQGFTYRLVDEEQCARFMRLRGEEFAEVIQRNTERNTPRPTDRLTMRHTNLANNVLSDGTYDDLSPFSSSRETKTTTTESTALDEYLKDPELGYWKDKGINNRQVNSWSEEFQMPVEQLIQSLKYCRYDMVVLNQEEEKQISNPMNWFYKVMQRSGLYPKPNGYRSLAEIRVEQMEQAAKEAAEVRNRQIAAEQEMAFQKIMSAPDGVEYKALIAKVDSFAREMGGKALEVAMREAFTNRPQTV